MLLATTGAGAGAGVVGGAGAGAGVTTAVAGAGAGVTRGGAGAGVVVTTEVVVKVVVVGAGAGASAGAAAGAAAGLAAGGSCGVCRSIHLPMLPQLGENQCNVFMGCGSWGTHGSPPASSFTIHLEGLAGRNIGSPAITANPTNRLKLVPSFFLAVDTKAQTTLEL